MRYASVLAAAVLWAPTAQAQTTSDPSPKPQDKPAPADTAVSGVTVNGAARPEVETSIDRRSYSVADDLQAKTGAIGDVLRNIPSVQVDVQGNLSLRGDPNVTILVDGKPSSQFSPANQAQALQSLPADQIDRIEVITNPSAEFRADGTGGIINLITKKAKGAGTTASARLQVGVTGRETLSGTVGYNSAKLSVTANTIFQHVEIIQSALAAQTSENANPGGAETNLDTSKAHVPENVAFGHVGADYDISDKTRLSGSLRFAYIHADAELADAFVDSNAGTISAFNRATEQNNTAYNGQASVILRHKYAEGNDLTLNASYSGNQQALDQIYDISPTLPPSAATAMAVYRANFNRTSMFTADYERPLGEAKLKIGYDVEYTGNLVEHRGGMGVPGAITPLPGQTDNFSDDETHNQAYVTYGRTFGRLDALFGLRAESVQLALAQQAQALPGQTYDRFYPTLHLAYDLKDGRRLTASYSKRVVRPQPVDLDPFPFLSDPDALWQGNPNLKPQDTDSYELGYENRKGAASFLATAYYRQTNNAFAWIYTPQDNGVLLQQRENAGYQANGGVELVWANQLTPKLTYNLSADAYRAEISAPYLNAVLTQSAFTGFGRANLNWQVTPKDFMQFNLFVNGKSLVPQGYVEPTVSGNIGYRHTINNKVSWMFVVQDPFHTLKNRMVLDTAGGTDRRSFQNNTRAAFLTLIWNFSGKPQPTNFDFAPGGTGG